MKIGLIGSRRRNSAEDYLLVEKTFLLWYKEGDQIVSGGCPSGADHFAEIIAKKYSVPITIYYANWNKYGKAAGFRRNGKIAEESDVLIACVADDRTGGTEDTIKKYVKLGKVQLVLLWRNI